MAQRIRPLARLFRAALKGVFHGPGEQRRPRRFRPRLEPLETRLNPATFTESGTVLNITLTNPNEGLTLHSLGPTGVTVDESAGNTTSGTASSLHVTGLGTATATVTANGVSFYTSIQIRGTVGVHGDRVTFADSGGQNYFNAFDVNLTDGASGNITFDGINWFNNVSLSAATAGGMVVSTASSWLALFGSGGNLALRSAAGRPLELLGQVQVTGTTSLTGGDVRAANANNSFTGALALDAGGAVNLFAGGSLNLGPGVFHVAGRTGPSQITAAGDINQSGALGTSVTTSEQEFVRFTSTGGNLDLTNPGNRFDGLTVGLAVSGSHTASLFSTGKVTLGNVTTGTGLLSIRARGDVEEVSTITTLGPANFIVDTVSGSIALDKFGINTFGGLVTLGETNGGTLRDVSFRNANPAAASLLSIPALASPGHIHDYALQFDNAAVALPTLNVSGKLDVTAGGSLTQQAGTGITTGAGAHFAVLGNAAITLTNAGNHLAGDVGIDAAHSSQAVQLACAGAVSLGDVHLGRGAFSLTAGGNITTDPGSSVTQEKGAAEADFNVTAGDTIALDKANEFPGQVRLGGSGTTLTHVNFRNADPLARFANLVLPPGVTDLTVQFDNAAVVLPTLILTNLTVTAQGIYQQQTPSPTALTVTNQATFNANAFPIVLANTGNGFNAVTLNNSGRNNVSITNGPNDLTFTGASRIGSGRLAISSPNIIREATGAAIVQEANAGPVTLGSSTAILLDQANQFTGAVGVQHSVGVVVVNNSSGDLILGGVQDSLGLGSLTASAAGGAIRQAAGTTITWHNAAAFTARDQIALDNRGNNFGGAVALTTTAGDARLRTEGALGLAACNLGSHDLSVTANGTVSQLGGAVVAGRASFTSLTGGLSLTGSNDFAALSLSAPGGVAVTDVNALNLDVVALGAGTFSVSTGGDLGETTSGAITQAGPGAVTLTTGAGQNLRLGNGGNNLPGTVTVTHSRDVTLTTRGDLTFDPGSAITGNLSASAGGALTLPGDLSHLASLTTTARSTAINANVTTSAAAGVTLTGAVTFAAGVVVDASAGSGTVTLNGDVTASGPLTFNLSTSGQLLYERGTWNQGTSDLTINGGQASFEIGTAATLGQVPPTFAMSGGTINMPGGGNLDVYGTFKVGSTSAPEVVRVNNGVGQLSFHSTYEVGLGGTNDQLIKQGTGNLNLSARLVGDGLAAAPSAVLGAPDGATILGRFALSFDENGNPTPFLAGSDVVAATYTATQTLIGQSGTVSAGGTFTGFTPRGDKVTITSSLGSAAGLVVLPEVPLLDETEGFSVVVRNSTSALASTLTITTAAATGGPAYSPILGIAVNTPGAVAINAAGSDISGEVRTAGTLTGLTVHDLRGATITDGGTGPTTLSAKVVSFTAVNLRGALTSLRATSVDYFSSFTASTFGAITTTGDAALHDPGDFGASLTSLAASGTVLGTATIAGTLSGRSATERSVWDLGGNVGTVKAGTTYYWDLGAVSGANQRNAGLLGNIASLNLGQLSSSSINAAGGLASLTAGSIDQTSIQALSAGSIRTNGSIHTVTLTLTGNAGGTGALALGALTAAGGLLGTTVMARNGNIGSITVKGQVEACTITAAGGAIGSVTAGEFSSVLNDTTTIDARSLGTLKTVGNLAAGLFGDVNHLQVTLRGNAGGTAAVALGSFSASGAVASSTFDLQNGGLTSFTVGRQIQDSKFTLGDGLTGNLGSIRAGDWQFTDLTARTVGSLTVAGVPAAFSRSGPLQGNLTGRINVFGTQGGAATLGALKVAGSLFGPTLTAPHGIGSFTVGRQVSADVVVDDSLPGVAAVGRVGTLTAGSFVGATLTANTLGAVNITGYTSPNGAVFGSAGDVEGTIVVAGATPTLPVGVGSFTVRHDFFGSLTALDGIGKLTVGGTLESARVTTDNPLAPSLGVLGTLSAGGIDHTTLRTSTMGTLTVTGGSAASSVLGSFSDSSLSVNNASPTTPALKTFAVPADLESFDATSVDVPGRVLSFRVGGEVSFGRLAMGYAPGARIDSLSVGQWYHNDLTAFSVSSFKVTGNGTSGLAALGGDSFIDVIGNIAGVGLGTFSATGTVSDAVFSIADGNVTSFTAGRFRDSDLLVGVILPAAGDITLGTPTWGGVNRSIGTFQTTAPFGSSDVADTASFARSKVVAAVLGAVTLSGVDPTNDPRASSAVTFGVAFRAGAGAAARGTVKVNGSAAALAPSASPALAPDFFYLGLPG
jgi:hypothetical protein